MRSTRGRGFTLVELLVVIGIIGLLVTFLIGALLPQKKKAMKAKTAALIKAVQTALDAYYAEFHDYPPDGYDKETGWNANNGSCTETGQAKGLELPVGSGCYYAGSGSLIYFLCYPITNIYTVGSDQGSVDVRNIRTTPVGPYLNTLRNEDISVKFWDPTFDLAIRPVTRGGPAGSSYLTTWAAGEIVDAFGFPIHYDKVKDLGDPNYATYFSPGRFSGANGVLCHTDITYYTSYVQGVMNNPEFDPCADGSHSCAIGSAGTGSAPKHSDPRSQAQTDGCYIDDNLAKPRNSNAYDLWAHADSFCNGRSAISNWKQ